MKKAYKVKREAMVPYSCEQMYALISDVDSYSSFLPWCPRSGIEQQHGNQVHARIAYRWKGVEDSFVTRNTHVPNSSIIMELLEGPFKELQGQWLFTPVAEHACKLQFFLHFSFRNPVYGMVMDPLFKRLANSLLDNFLKRAKSLYQRDLKTS